MHAYTLCFIKRNDEILMLNRQKKPWKGAWNGVGGKIHGGETPLDCIIREVFEETQITVDVTKIADKGELTWTNFEAIGIGLHLFLYEVPNDFKLETPIKTIEGILDWKKISWIVDFENEGMAKNIPYFLPTLLEKPERHHYHCTFENTHLTSVTIEPCLSEFH